MLWSAWGFGVVVGAGLSSLAWLALAVNASAPAEERSVATSGCPPCVQRSTAPVTGSRFDSEIRGDLRARCEAFCTARTLPPCVPDRFEATSAEAWPEELPREMSPEYLRHAVQQLRAVCPDVYTADIALDCRAFPCVLMWADLGDEPRARLRDCPATAHWLGELRYPPGHTSASASGSVSVHGRAVVPQAGHHAVSGSLHDAMHEVGQRVREHMARALREACEVHDDPGACAAAARRYDGRDRAAAIALALRGCDLDDAEACRTLARLTDDEGEAAAARAEACDAGSAPACERLLRARCPRGGPCRDGAVALARKAVRGALDGVERHRDERPDHPASSYLHDRVADAYRALGDTLCRRDQVARAAEAFAEACAAEASARDIRCARGGWRSRSSSCGRTCEAAAP